MNRHCFALDLIDNEALIAEYEQIHKNIWPEIHQSILEAGIEMMEIYRIGNRLFMVMEVNADFSFERKAKIDAESAIVQKWEAKMWQYQQALPMAKPGEKWLKMEKIFDLQNR